MRLEGSCHCGAVRFQVASRYPYPFNLCYCKICRKTAGTGGYAINISARNDTLEIEGHEHISRYHAVLERHKNEETRSEAQRSFCRECGTALWLWDPRWPELVHPHASAVDTPLPLPPERTHMMLSSKPSWVEVKADPQDSCFDDYPDESLAAWHERLGLEQ
ncbi:MAG: GFA family protein [Candidatus Omnitrophota bacterium]